MLYLPFVGGVIVIAISFAVPFFRDIVTESIMSLALFILYSLCFVYIGPVANIYIYLAVRRSKTLEQLSEKWMKRVESAENISKVDSTA